MLVASDGVPVNSQDGAHPGPMIPVTHFRLPTAATAEFIVTTPPAGVKSAQLVTTSVNTGPDGDCDPTRPIFNIVPGGNSQSKSLALNSQARDTTVPAFTGLSKGGRRFAGLGTAPVAVSRVVYFDENANDQFFMAVEGKPEHVFDPNAPADITATQGTVEEWTVENRTLESHEFHIHQIHFLVESQDYFQVNGQRPAPAVVGQYLDMIDVPGWDGNPAHPYPSVKLRLDFRGPDIGDFVFHCHILEHEDHGMMNIIRVVPPPPKAPIRPSLRGTGLLWPRSLPVRRLLRSRRVQFPACWRGTQGCTDENLAVRPPGHQTAAGKRAACRIGARRRLRENGEISVQVCAWPGSCCPRFHNRDLGHPTSMFSQEQNRNRCIARVDFSARPFGCQPFHKKLHESLFVRLQADVCVGWGALDGLGEALVVYLDMHGSYRAELRIDGVGDGYRVKERGGGRMPLGMRVPLVIEQGSVDR